MKGPKPSADYSWMTDIHSNIQLFEILFIFPYDHHSFFVHVRQSLSYNELVQKLHIACISDCWIERCMWLLSRKLRHLNSRCKEAQTRLKWYYAVIHAASAEGLCFQGPFIRSSAPRGRETFRIRIRPSPALAASFLRSSDILHQMRRPLPLI